ncbi:right-handed parallel beta-helix repeat-containing protein, partial [bacterium]|nr:right-handed parallel beta-helix repeat-containing protein [bacterium]
MRRVSISLCLVLLMISSAWADTYTVSPGESIQDAIDLAGPNDTIEVAAGHYEGQLHIYTENLTIVGAGKTATFVDSPASLPLFFGTNYPVVFIDGVDNVTISDLTVDGLGRGDANYRFQGIAFWNSGGSLQDLHVVNIMDTPFSGAQHGVGVYAYNDTGGPYTVNITDVEIDAFQKNATALSGDGLTANLLRVVMTGAGATDVTAQNCIQIGFGASGTATDCQVYDVHYTPSSWAATGVLGYDGGTMDLDNVTVDGCGTGIDFYEISGSVDGCTVQNPYGDALYAENGGAKAGGRRTCQPFPEDRPAGTAKGAVSVVVTDSEFYGNEVVDSWGPSAYVLGPVDFVMTGSTVSGWDWGMVIYESGGIATGYAHDNTLAGNTTYDAYFQMAGEFDASMNFWGGNDPHDVTGYGTKGPPKLSPWYLLPPGSIPMSWGVKGTIQDAINAANPNDTINVAAGVYDEMLNVNKPLTLNGANAGVHPVVGKHPTELVGTRGPETDLSHNGLYAMRPSADNITVDGFLFSGDGGRIIDTYADANGFHLTNCIFENDATA